MSVLFDESIVKMSVSFWACSWHKVKCPAFQCVVSVMHAFQVWEMSKVHTRQMPNNREQITEILEGRLYSKKQYKLSWWTCISEMVKLSWWYVK